MSDDELADYLQKLSEQFKQTVIMIKHDLELAQVS